MSRDAWRFVRDKTTQYDRTLGEFGFAPDGNEQFETSRKE
jgi:hypothetical protein